MSTTAAPRPTRRKRATPDEPTPEQRDAPETERSASPPPERPAPTRAPAAPMDLRSIPLTDIHESPFNTRTHFDRVKLEELAASMKLSGQLEPVLVRPSKLPGKSGYELAAGHRRRRAAEIAGLPELLAIVRDLDDRAFLEILSIDNLQREDVHPLEEAQGYKNLLTLDGYNHKLIAERVGKTESYVYDRLKLLQLIPAAKKLFLADRFTLGHAIILARVTSDVQKRLIEDTDSGGGLWRSDMGHATLGLLSPDAEGEVDKVFGGLVPVSVRELQQWIDEHVRFDASDASVPQLFPDTAQQLKLATMRKDKVVEITYDYHVHPDAKDEEGKRTYGPTSWKRADGEPETDPGGKTSVSKTCEYSVQGLVAAGEHRGESFRVCVDKKHCTVHWGAEIRERNKRERARENGDAPAASKSAAPKEQSWQREQRLREERTTRATARWAKGGDAVLRAIAPAVKKLAVGGKTPATAFFLRIVEDGLYGLADSGKQAESLGVPQGSTPADLIRHVIMAALLDTGEPGNYDATNEKDLQKDLNDLKIRVDVVKLLDAANPAPVDSKASPKPEATKAARAKKTASRRG